MLNYDYRSDDRPILEIKDLKVSFEGIKAVSDFSLLLKKGELKGLIGPNGAGKTTIFNLISGYRKADTGKILYKGIDITYETPDKKVKRGIARTFQKVRIEQQVKVIDEMKTAFFRHMTYNFVDILLQTNKYRREETKIEAEAFEILDFLGISSLSDQVGEDIPHGQQMKVSIARALAMKPEILLLDEPTSGLNTGETLELMNLILRMKEKYDLSILLIEHDMNVIMGICHDIIVMNEGRIIGEGKPEEIQNNQKVIEAYLGGAK